MSVGGEWGVLDRRRQNMFLFIMMVREPSPSPHLLHPSPSIHKTDMCSKVLQNCRVKNKIKHQVVEGMWVRMRTDGMSQLKPPAGEMRVCSDPGHAHRSLFGLETLKKP